MSGTLQAIVFDFDGVIADSEPLHLRAFQQTLAEGRIELSGRDYYSRYLGYDDVGLLQALAADRGMPLSDHEITALVARKGARLQELMRADHVTAFEPSADSEPPSVTCLKTLTAPNALPSGPNRS